jgi:transcriptional regulator with XRE-family HTH domain
MMDRLPVPIGIPGPAVVRSVPQTVPQRKGFMELVDMKGLAGRMLEAFNASGLKRTSLAKACSTSRSRVEGWFKGQNVTADNLKAFIAATEVDGHWLLTGEGEMLRTGPDEAQLRIQRARKVAADLHAALSGPIDPPELAAPEHKPEPPPDPPRPANGKPSRRRTGDDPEQKPE